MLKILGKRVAWCVIYEIIVRVFSEYFKFPLTRNSSHIFTLDAKLIDAANSPPLYLKVAQHFNVPWSRWIYSSLPSSNLSKYL